MFAWGTHGGRSNVEIGTMKGGKPVKKKSKAVALSSALIHLDWSQDSQTLMMNIQGGELLFFDT